MNVTEKIVLGREENIVGKGENAFKTFLSGSGLCLKG